LADWVSLNTMTFSGSITTAGYTDTNRYEFYCVYVASQSGGGAITATVQR
jgi:hypothetical protein